MMKENQPDRSDPDAHSQEIQALRAEIDALRLQNQSLWIELERFTDSRFLTRKLVLTLRQRVTNRVQKIKKNLGVSPRQLSNNGGSSHFKAYHARILRPLRPNRPRVLHAIGNFYTGGSARLVVDLIEHLGHRYDQAVITRDLPDAPAYTGMNIHQYEEFENPRQVLSLLNSIRPHILHVHYLGHHKTSYSHLDWKWYNSVMQAAQEYGCKIIENINIPVAPYVSDSISWYVYVSDYVRREFGWANDRSTTIYPGSDFTLFSRRNGAGIPDDCIGMVYRLEGDKLNETSIDVFIKAIERRRGTRALIVGGGRFLTTYKDRVHRAGLDCAFTFTDYISYEDLPALYEQMSIFVAPVHRESFGQVSPFAMSMGIPVVGYDVGALPEIIADPELLAPAGDSDKLADILVDLLNDRARRLGIGALNRQRAHDMFSVEAMIRRYDALYEEP
jgi:glycosyltransferase involved in cell wall biosynthesis